MQILYIFFCRTQIDKLLLMEGGQYHKPDNTAVVIMRGIHHHKNNPLSRHHILKPLMDPKLPYTPLDLWVKEVKYSDKSQRYYTPMQISEEDCHSPIFSLPHNTNLLVRAIMKILY